MNVRIEKPLKKGETRYGTLSREQNGAVCFDETQQWLNSTRRRSVRLKKFEKFGTSVTRKPDHIVIRHEIPLTADFSFMQDLERGEELCDALTYVGSYMERRRK